MIKAKDIALIGIMAAIIEVCKVIMAGIPNVEVTSFLIIMFCIFFRGNYFCYILIPVFILIEGLIFGFGLWWLQYLFAWPVLAFVASKLYTMDSACGWAIVSGIFGLIFGALCSIPYFFMGGPATAFAWWVAGIPWDLVHGVANFIIMLVLYKPMNKVLKTLKRTV